MIAMHRQLKSSQTKRRALASPCAVLRNSLRLNTLALLLAAAAGSALLAPKVSAAEPPSKTTGKVTVKTEQLHQIEVVVAESRSISPLKSAIGQIAFNEDASTNVLAPFSGRVTRVIARVGDEVKRGAPLFEIDSPEVMQAQTDLIGAVQAVEKYRAQLGLARRVVDRLSALLAGNATSQRELDQARSDHASAEADYQTAQSSLTAARNKLRVIVGRGQAEVERVERERTPQALLTINAPIDGTVITRKIGTGQYVRADAGEPLYTITDLSTMWLKAFVAEADSPFVRKDQAIEVRITALPDRVFNARITAIAAASDPQTRRLAVRSELPNPEGVLKAEMFASFRIAVGKPETGPVVPVEAIIREGEKSDVWVQTGALDFQRREVKLGLEQDGMIMIREGLKAGEKIISRGAVFVDNEDKQ